MLQPRAYNSTWITHRPLAHRGLHGPGVPENSLAAFRAAARAGYAIELDLRLSADRIPIVMHDRNTARMTGRNMEIAKTRSSDLVKLTLGGSQETIPTLAAALATIGGSVPIGIEVKTGTDMRVFGPILVDALAGYDGEVIVGSFDPLILLWFRRRAPQLPRMQIAGLIPERPGPILLKYGLRLMPLNWLTRPSAIGFDCREIPSRVLAFWQTWLKIPAVLYTASTPAQLDAARNGGFNVVFEGVRP